MHRRCAMDDDKLDFSSLDPARDRERWQRRVDDVVARAQASRQSGRWARELSALARPALALAAAAALLVWSATWLAPGRRSASGTRVDPAERLMEWSTSD